jgi:hypothetical protein
MTMQQPNVFDKSTLVNAIHAAGFPSLEHAAMAEREGYAVMTGTGDGLEWNWDRDRLRAMADEDLQALYRGIVGVPQ